MKKIIYMASALFFSAYMTSCGGGNEEATMDGMDSMAVDTAPAAMEAPQEMISIPSPDEMFSFIRDLGGAGKSTQHLNNPDNAKNYVDNKAKALNFGVYATDFLYCSTFDYGTEGLKYFVTVKKLGDELGISGAISESTMERIKSNIGKNDSLTNISNTLYYSAISELEGSDKASVLALVIAGGWVESMHLVTNMVTKFDAANPAIERIAEQKFTLENLTAYLGQYSSDENVSSVAAQLNDLMAVYNSLEEQTSEGGVTMQGNNKVLGGGSDINMTEAQFKQISDKIHEIRNSFTK